MPPELPASALYASPALGRLWKKVHLARSPFVIRSGVRRLYIHPAPVLRKLLSGKAYHWIALGCADGLKESLLSRKIPAPTSFHAADTNPTLARMATLRLRAPVKSWSRIDLTSQRLPSSISHLPRPWLVTLFGVLPNLDALPLLQSLHRSMKPGDLLLFSANLAPGWSGFAGARQILPQYDNGPTRVWLEAAVHRYRPSLPAGKLVFGVFPDPHQKSLARIESRWLAKNKNWIVFASRRPTSSQVEAWVRTTQLRKLACYLDPLGEEGVWLVTRKA